MLDSYSNIYPLEGIQLSGMLDCIFSSLFLNYCASTTGVRIIIDIFFDKQESELDIIGSRVETDIPESRILADFQKHSLGMRSQSANETTHV